MVAIITGASDGIGLRVAKSLQAQGYSEDERKRPHHFHFIPYGRHPLPYLGFYSASKAALTAYAFALRAEPDPFGIAVGTVALGGKKGYGPARAASLSLPRGSGLQASEEAAWAKATSAKSTGVKSNWEWPMYAGHIRELCHLLLKKAPAPLCAPAKSPLYRINKDSEMRISKRL